ncbi:MAG TPA: hypothetical protein VF677_04280 [Flavobacterium sp.]|jgi:hypothetical protein
MDTLFHKKVVFAKILNAQRKLRVLIFCILYFILSSCNLPIDSNDAKRSYKYWAGQEPPKNLKVLNGEYKQSLHFTLEYRLYLKIAQNPSWWDSLKIQNNLVFDSAKWTPPNNCPLWFKPSLSSKKWKPIDNFNNSRFLEDPDKGDYYVYIEQN